MFTEKNLENTEKHREDKIISTQSNLNMQFDVFLSSLFFMKWNDKTNIVTMLYIWYTKLIFPKVLEEYNI